MDRYQVISLLKKKHLYSLGHSGDIAKFFNKIRFKARISETWEHFIVKSIIGMLIRKKGDFFLCEYPFPSGRIYDIIQIVRKTGELVGYEVESKEFKKTEEIDTVVIYLKKLPLQNLKLLINELEKYIV